MLKRKVSVTSTASNPAPKNQRTEDVIVIEQTSPLSVAIDEGYISEIESSSSFYDFDDDVDDDADDEGDYEDGAYDYDLESARNTKVAHERFFEAQVWQSLNRTLSDEKIEKLPLGDITARFHPTRGGRWTLYSSVYHQECFFDNELAHETKYLSFMPAATRDGTATDYVYGYVHIYPAGKITILPFVPPKTASLKPVEVECIAVGNGIEKTRKECRLWFLGEGALKIEIDIGMLLGRYIGSREVGEDGVAVFSGLYERYEELSERIMEQGRRRWGWGEKLTG